MAKIWRTFQYKLAKLLEFSLGRKKQIPFFCSEKEHYLFMANGTFLLYVQLCDGENLANFSRKKKLAKLVKFSLWKKKNPNFLFRKRTPLIYGKCI
jgi:hypothetical protein